MTDYKNLVEVNKLSKFYRQKKDRKVFSDVEEAKKYFLTIRAIEQFNKYCYKQKWQLTSDRMALHWTISFALDGSTEPNSTKWNESKAKMCEDDVWFVQGNWALIDHEAADLF